jgi:hypothetical protein
MRRYAMCSSFADNSGWLIIIQELLLLLEKR